jgi:serine phosphatase RsbU (regulator of sigma subunit)
LQKGDTIYLSSDGYADQFSPSDKKLMTKKFKEVLLSIQHLSMPEQEKYLDNFIADWRSNMEQTDDVLVIGVRVV